MLCIHLTILAWLLLFGIFCTSAAVQATTISINVYDETVNPLQDGKAMYQIPEPDSDLHIFALPVGQGDCTVIQCPATTNTDSTSSGGEIYIVDLGADKKAWNRERVVQFLLPQRSLISGVIITHGNIDHYIYSEEVLSYFRDTNDLGDFGDVFYGYSTINGEQFDAWQGVTGMSDNGWILYGGSLDDDYKKGFPEFVERFFDNDDTNRKSQAFDTRCAFEEQTTSETTIEKCSLPRTTPVSCGSATIEIVWANMGGFDKSIPADENGS